MTGAGVILGTAAYMSPEQARGKTVDRRADIWAFGAVLFEILSGVRPFDGEDMTEVLGAVVRLEPQWGALPSDVPPPIRTLLQSCLVKDPRRRVADISTALFVLDRTESLASPTAGDAWTRRPDPAIVQQQLRQQTETAVAEVRRTLGRRVALIAVAALITGAAAGMAVWSVARTVPVPPETRVESSRPPPIGPFTSPSPPTADRSSSWPPAMVPPASGCGRWRQPPRSRWREPRAPRVPSGRPTAGPSASSPRQALKRLDIGGGTPQTLATVEGPRSGTWNADGVILFSPDHHKSAVPRAGFRRRSRGGDEA